MTLVTAPVQTPAPPADPRAPAPGSGHSVTVSSRPPGAGGSGAARAPNVGAGLDDRTATAARQQSLGMGAELREFLGDELTARLDAFTDTDSALDPPSRTDGPGAYQGEVGHADSPAGTRPRQIYGELVPVDPPGVDAPGQTQAVPVPDPAAGAGAGTVAALMERQSLSARAGLATLSTMLAELKNPAGQADAPALANIDTDKLERAQQLLQDAATMKPRVSGGQLAAQARRPGEFQAALDRGDRKAAVAAQNKAMESYMGAKKSSAAAKSEARQVFLEAVDKYLDGKRTHLEVTRLAGADDLSAAAILHPDERVSLLIARSAERAIERGRVGLERQPQYEQLTNPKKVRARLEQNLQQELRAGFEPVEKSLQHGGQTYTSKLTPDLPAAGDGRRPAVLCSDSHEPARAPNLWATQYQSGAGATLFKGARHGTLSAFGMIPKHLKRLPKQELHDLIKKTLPGPAQRLGVERCAKHMTSRFSIIGHSLRRGAREQATRNRALDLVRFNLQNNDKLMRQLDDNKAARPSVALELPSINLITPDKTRRLLATFNSGEQRDELRMTREQDRALKALSKQPLPVEVTDRDGATRTVLAQVKPLTFSMGVNVLAIGKAKRFFPSWGAADGISRPAVERLLGARPQAGKTPASGLVAERLRELEQAGQGDSREAQTIRQLADQVARIWQAKSHHAESNEPYALPARLALLTHKLGLMPSFNCKSGKDRTGQLDAEIKFLATRIEQDNGTVPEPGAELDADQKALYAKVVLNSGQHEIQRMNTGSPGYKVKLPALSRRLGGVVNQIQHLGQGKFVSA